ncbi:MAG: flagellin [Rhodobacteraceae bacterium]|nr:flagellin [Paracoccaceae bacterium]
MSSILTNTSAMVALQTLKQVNNSLDKTQAEIATGKQVANARDNAATWAIAKTMESDVTGFRGISESLSLGESTIGVGRQAAETVTSLLTELKGKIVSAQEENVDRGKIQTDIAELRSQIETVVNAAQFNGLNMVKGTDQVNILSSLDRDSAGNVTASQISVGRQDLTTSAGTLGSGQVLNANATASAGAVSDAGNTAEITFNNGDYTTAGLMARITIEGRQIDFSGAAGLDQNDAAAFFEGAINALQLDGITAEATGGVLEITSNRAFSGVDIAISDLAGDAAGTVVSEINGDATAPGTLSGSIDERAQSVTFSGTAAVQNGDGYSVTVGTQSFSYVAGPNQSFEDVARGLKAAIDGGRLDGVTAQVAQDADGRWQLQVDNNDGSLAFSVLGNAGGTASGGLFGLEGMDVRTTEGAQAALENV